MRNSETYTGYQGEHIWTSIYKENCFVTAGEGGEVCQEEKMLFKIISGLHSNINLHLSKNILDPEKNVTFANNSMFLDRVGRHPDRLNNMFYLYSLLIKAFYRAEDSIKQFAIETGDSAEDSYAKEQIDHIFRLKANASFLFQGDEEDITKFLNLRKLDQVKSRFRNISAIIDCVSCQKCKLHFKLQIYGLCIILTKPQC